MALRKPLPPLNWLRAFEAAARHLSFTAAAAELNMTQSAVSQQIKSLEGHMGRALFHRHPRALELTVTGASYLPIVRDAFRTLSRGTMAVTGGTENVVQVHANMSFGTFWLAPRLGRFYARHPDLRLNITAELWEQVSGIAPGADIEIRYSVRPSEGIVTQKLVQDYAYPVAPPGWTGTLDDIPNETLFDCANLMATWAAWGEDLGLDWSGLNVTYATTYAVALSAAVAGSGLCMAHDTIAGRLIAEGRLQRLFDHRAEMQEAYYLVTAPHIEEVPGALAFVDWLLEEMDLDQRGRDATQA
ncbi:LysR substrate-binding domain-containing protein [Roseovarius sp. MMSF_3359]|uniref:LysR substrate-binding domain-containing protein n=1 Tax=unclassified Roseovarius TaxID=2614913 RepID=UPI003531809B